ncbi:MAG: hypothetical protein KJZ86_15415 [Caldilineaceae bacterium]|nr:hypothetical protein [Caldilineaceae bacterium]HRJ43719.1 hypothetical protein [Caldilineaceae bacterium]
MEANPPPKEPDHSRPFLRRALPVALILIGLVVTILFGLRSVHSFRTVRYIQQQGLDRGTASVEAIQPWMTIRFVAVAYAVPEEYLYAALEIPFDRRNANRPLRRLRPGPEKSDEPPPTATADFGTAIVERAQAAVLAYRADPVVTGLRDVRAWMSLRYISHSTGIPLDDLYSQTGLASTVNPDKPLSLVAEEESYPGGPRGLEEALARFLGLQPGGQRP